ncbi:MAG: ROK family protein [Patescibacteria group bacterium]|nr:ROK family protein [Patescibacteria group bacterium]
MSYSIGLDIGGTKINTGIVKNNRVFKNHQIKSPSKKGPKKLLREIKKAINYYQPEKAKNIAISFAGPVDKKGKILHATNFSSTLENYNLKKALRKIFKKEIFIEHDGFCFVLAESILGAAKNYKYIIGLTLGSGIGGGLAVDNKIYTGYKNLAEIGHFKILEKGFQCSCGRFGHFEAQACGFSLEKYYKKITGQNRSGKEIYKLSKKGDKKALKAAEITAKYLGLGLASLTNVLSPEIIVLGGGLSNFTKIITLSKKSFKQELVDPRHKKTKIVKSKLGQKALLLGAYLTTKKRNYKL